MKKTNPILIICSQVIGVYLLLTSNRTYHYEHDAPLFKLSGSMQSSTFLGDLRLIREFDDVNSGRWVASLQSVLVYLFIIGVIVSVVICVMIIADRIGREKLRRIIQCIPTAILLLILIIGRLPILHEDYSALSSYFAKDHAYYLEIGNIGLVVLFLLIAAAVIAWLPKLSSEKSQTVTTEKEAERKIKIPKPTNKGASSYTSDTKKALLNLQELYKQGLITEEEYNEKRKVYIDKL